MAALPEHWLRGPVPGVDAVLMPAAHALLQAREDIERLAPGLDDERLWLRPGGAASAGFHLQHLAGSLDRLFTYARGAALDDRQREELRAEGTPASAAALVDRALQTIDRALDQLRATSRDTVFETRAVGRAKLPATVIGLLSHGAEHTTRHVGQLITTLKVVSGSKSSAR
jgi:uncharacterized damage-inducible protein DinB